MSSPPPPPYRARRRGDAGDQPSRGRSRRWPRPYRPARRAASISDPPSPVRVFQDRPLSPPSPGPSYADTFRRGLGTRPHEQESWSASDSSLPDANIVGHDLDDSPPQHKEESGSSESGSSGSELDSSPCITMQSEPENQEPDSPTSPSGSQPPIKVNSPGSLIDSPSDEEDLSKSDEEDAYFNYLVDKTATAAADVCGSTLSDDDIDYKARAVRKSALYAESALKHYNNDEKNKIKYELCSGITCSDILVRKGCFCHVNFTAKGNQQNAKQELFFAELLHDHGTLVPICVVSLHGIKKAGGLRDSKYDKLRLGGGVPIDKQHCYACKRNLKHPRNGELYEIGHVAMSANYMSAL